MEAKSLLEYLGTFKNHFDNWDQIAALIGESLKSSDGMPAGSVSEEEASDRNKIKSTGGQVHSRGGITLGHTVEHTAIVSSGYWLFLIVILALGERNLSRRRQYHFADGFAGILLLMTSRLLPAISTWNHNFVSLLWSGQWWSSKLFQPEIRTQSTEC